MSRSNSSSLIRPFPCISRRSPSVSGSVGSSTSPMTYFFRNHRITAPSASTSTSRMTPTIVIDVQFRAARFCCARTIQPIGITDSNRIITVDALLAGDLAVFLDALWHLVLPALALAMGGMAQEARITRSTMSDNLTKDYIASERSLGIPERVIMRSFLLKPSLIPTVSILGLDFAATLSNAFLVELIFNWPGMSRYGINAMLR